MLEHVECILLICTGKQRPRTSRQNRPGSPATTFALLPKTFTDLRPEINNFFRKNKIQVVKDTTQPRNLFSNSQQPFKLDIFEIRLINVDVRRKITKPTIHVAGDECEATENKELARLLFPKLNVKGISSEYLDDETFTYGVIDDRSTQFIEACLSHGAEFGYRHRDAGTVLHFAININSLALLKMFVKYGYDVNTPQSTDGWAPLHCAVANGQFQIVKTLVQNGANVNAVTKERYCDDDFPGKTPLLLATRNNHSKVVKFLLSHGANVNVEDHSYCRSSKSEYHGWTTPLQIASREGHLSVVKVLAKRSAGIDRKGSGDFVYCSTPLMHAAENGNLEVVNLLLYRGANANGIQNAKPFCLEGGDEDQCGSTALGSAAIYGHAAVVKFLLSQGANVNGDGSRRHPVLAAAGRGHMDAVKLLLEAGADINAQDLYHCGEHPDHGRDLLLIAFQKGNRDLLELILSRRSELGDTRILRAFYFALRTCSNFCKEHVNSICPVNFSFNDENLKNVDMEQLFFGAIHKNRADLVEQLLRRGVKVNSTISWCSEFHGAPLHLAAASDSEGNIVKLLIEHGANVNMLDEKGRSPLNHAVRENNLNAINVLKDANANFHGDFELILVAIIFSNAEILEEVLLNGADTTFEQEPVMSSIVLVCVFKLNDMAKLKLCLKFGHGIKYHSTEDSSEMELILAACVKTKKLDAFRTILEYNFNDKINADLLARSFESFLPEYIDHKDWFNTLKCHLVKMTSVGLRIEISEDLEGFISPEIDDFNLRCDTEVQQMKNTKVGGTDVSFFDILIHDVCHISNYLENNSIEQEFQIAAYKKKYPIYESILEWQFEKGSHRRFLLHRGIRILKKLLIHFSALPDELQKNIVSLLDNIDLQVLVCVCVSSQ